MDLVLLIEEATIIFNRIHILIRYIFEYLPISYSSPVVLAKHKILHNYLIYVSELCFIKHLADKSVKY